VPRLLVVHHSPTPTVQRLTDAVLAGARDEAVAGVDVHVRNALDAHADDVLAADGFLLGTTANFGYMSGALKHFFDTIFLEAGGALADDGSAAGHQACSRSACWWSPVLPRWSSMCVGRRPSAVLGREVHILLHNL
jgi:NAD(P)H-dependent FMN reductase